MNVVSAHPGDDVTVSVNVTADDGVPFNGNVTIIFPDGSSQTVEVINGSGNATWTVPDDLVEGDYPVNATFDGDNYYLPSNGTGIIEVVPKVATEISVDVVSAHPGDNVTVSVNVTADDGVPFNGNVTIIFPDGSSQTVEVIDGAGNATWTVPDDLVEGDYPVGAAFQGNNRYLPCEGQGTVTVFAVPVDMIVGNVDAKPGEDVTIPIKVVPRDGSVFNGKVTVELPDGTVRVVEIVNGEGSVVWTIPENFYGEYIVRVSFNGTGAYCPANGTCIITVIADVHPAEENKTSPVKPVDIKVDNKATGNPILALLMVLALLGVSINRRK